MKIRLILLCLLCSLNCLAQDSLLVEMLRQYTYPVQINKGELEGAGANWLKQETSQAQFVLIGEGHGLAQPPQFTAALFKLLYPAGFKYYVSEVGPAAASVLTPLLAEQQPQAISSFYQKYPMAFAFLAYQEESQMLKDMLQTTRYAPNTVWGIDQEFFLSTAPYLHYLSRQKGAKESKAVLERYALRADAETEEVLKTKDFSKLTLHTLTAEDFAALRSAVKQDKKALTIINDLQLSQEVYKTKSAYASNMLRIGLMKENLMKHYRAAQASGDTLPKAIFKFGATHMYRGKSLLGFYDIGNLAAELAASNNKTSMHILLIGDQGTVNNWRLVNDRATQQDTFNGQETFENMGVMPLFQLTDGKEWLIIDMKPVREKIYNGEVKNISKKLQDTIWAYDAILLMPEVTASTNF